MRIRLLVTITGLRNGAEWPPIGSVIDVPEDEAAQHIRMHNAEPAADAEMADRDWLDESYTLPEVDTW